MSMIWSTLLFAMYLVCDRFSTGLLTGGSGVASDVYVGDLAYPNICGRIQGSTGRAVGFRIPRRVLRIGNGGGRGRIGGLGGGVSGGAVGGPMAKRAIK